MNDSKDNSSFTAPLSFCAQVSVVPVLQFEDVKTALTICEALLTGGLSVLEITFRTCAAPECIEKVSREFPNAVVAAGSIRSQQQLQTAKDAGAKFAVSPGATDSLLCANILPLLPGAATASEVMNLQERGFDFVKFFPAAHIGGVAALKSFAGPLPDMKFCPTGGVSEESAPDYLALNNVACVGGSWLFSAKDSPESVCNKAKRASVLGGAHAAGKSGERVNT